MKRFVFALGVALLIAAVPSWTEKLAPNPAEYTVAIHVQSSRLAVDCSDVTGGNSVCGWVQQLKVLIDGKKFELNGTSRSADLLRVGDYKAKTLKEETKHPYEYLRTYEFLFPDGTVRDYYVSNESE
ncbi:MAG: hypothetical protein ABSD67_11920 [Terracidiphilus sp.]|jgi:hypothetical protein